MVPRRAMDGPPLEHRWSTPAREFADRDRERLPPRPLASRHELTFCIAVAALLVTPTARADAGPRASLELVAANKVILSDSSYLPNHHIVCRDLRFGVSTVPGSGVQRAPLTCRTAADSITPLVFKALRQNQPITAVFTFVAEAFHGSGGDLPLMTLTVTSARITAANAAAAPDRTASRSPRELRRTATIDRSTSAGYTRRVRTFEHASQVLGDLEMRVMGVLWEVSPLTVRDVKARLKGSKLAYTTVMTTLDRLYRKGLLARTKQGQAFVYLPAMDRTEYQRRVVQAAVAPLLAEGGSAVLAAFVDVAADVGDENLAQLERLIAARRKKT